MKKIVLAFIACIACGLSYAQNGYKIMGNIADGTIGKVHLIMDYDTLTTEIQEGRFELTGKVDETIMATIMVDSIMKAFPLFLENTDFKVTIDPSGEKVYAVEGGTEQAVWEEYQIVDEKFKGKNSEYLAAMQNATSREEYDSVRKEMSGLTKLQQEEENKLIQTYPDAAVSAWMVSRNVRLYTLEFSKKRFAMLSEKGKNTLYGRVAEEAIAAKERTLVGNIAPDFELTDVNGQTFKMSDVKARVKVLMFCKASIPVYREANKYIETVYNEYKEKGLEIISISWEEDREAWKQLVNEDKLPWKEGFDWKDGKSAVLELYGGKSHKVSHLYVLDENNRILYINVPYRSFRTCMERVFK